MPQENLLDELIDIIVKEGASDLHVAEGRPPVIRVSGYLIPLLKVPVTSTDDIKAFLSIFLSDEKRKEFEVNKEVNFAWSHAKTRFRGNAYLTLGKLSIALRLVPSRVRTLEELHLPPILESFAKRQQGFFLVVGPAGQGKSTTLATMIEMINMERLEHVVTIEDPVEYVFEPKKAIIDQREVKIDTPDFHTALWGVFRQDADVVMIGEMRDPETIATAVTAAETGHLILSTLHTNTAAQT
ncbi:MAG: ATPase, T2SS/T4P/T4SS family, partial [bacterium]|nr:ATPase, T2SS/T4P/T4SS family [bacterium]